MSAEGNPESRSLAELPRDELLSYGRGLGLALMDETPDGELLRRIRERQELLVELDRAAMLDVVVWARRPVRQSAGKEELARHIAEIQHADFTELSHRGLVVLARLRGVQVFQKMERQDIVTAIKKSEGLWTRMRRKRRSLTGSLLAKVLREDTPRQAGEYRFLPENGGPSLKTHIEEKGMVGGIASKLRGVADDYVRDKLDEIEVRIDRKLDEIDKRLGEWRDREVSNRLKILKITLIVSILVALLSLGYDRLRSQVRGGAVREQPSSRVDPGALVGEEHQGDVRAVDQTR